MTPEELIAKARDLIADPAHWCQYIGAKRADGVSTAYDDPAATQWCASAALAKFAGDDDILLAKANSILDKYIDGDLADTWYHVVLANRSVQRQYKRIWHVNDYLGHEAVLHILDRATKGKT